MIKSMTGFGRYEYREGQITAEAEIKSVNHRYCDVYVKLPRNLYYFEDKVKKFVASYISRGKMDVYISYKNTGDDTKEVIIDEALVDAYYNSLDKISKKYGLQNDVTPYILGRFPDALRVEKAEEDEEEIWSVFESCLKQAVNQLVEMRAIEGEKLKNDILDKLVNMEAFIAYIAEQSPLVVNEYKVKLENRIKDLVGQNQVDEMRLATEVAIFADKCSIDEELVRLNSHIIQLRDILKLDEPVGRKLDFLIQEMNREVNTIGSKANDLIITKNVVELKSELEKIREQVQNIE